MVWLLPTGGCTPPLPATSAQDGAIVGEEWCVCCTPAAHPPRILHPMRGMKNGGRGSVGASWLAISGRQIPRLTPRKVNCRQNSRNQGFSYYFCIIIEGSGSGSRAGSRSGSIPLNSGSGSGSRKTKNMWIRIRIRIRIRNTVFLIKKNMYFAKG